MGKFHIHRQQPRSDTHLDAVTYGVGNLYSLLGRRQPRPNSECVVTWRHRFMTYPVFRISIPGSSNTTLRIEPTGQGTFDVVVAEDSGATARLCTCETAELARRVQRAVLNSAERQSEATTRTVVSSRPARLPELWPGGLPNWQAETFLPGTCTRCGLERDVTGYVYKNWSGGYSLAGCFCWSCCEDVSTQLQAGLEPK